MWINWQIIHHTTMEFFFLEKSRVLIELLTMKLRIPCQYFVSPGSRDCVSVEHCSSVLVNTNREVGCYLLRTGKYWYQSQEYVESRWLYYCSSCSKHNKMVILIRITVCTVLDVFGVIFSWQLFQDHLENIT